MKSPNAFFAVTSLALILAGCGQTGPLYMPKPPARPAAAAPSKPVTPVVAPASEGAPAQTQPPATSSIPVQ